MKQRPLLSQAKQKKARKQIAVERGAVQATIAGLRAMQPAYMVRNEKLRKALKEKAS
jgi:hypothetical protein